MQTESQPNREFVYIKHSKNILPERTKPLMCQVPLYRERRRPSTHLTPTHSCKKISLHSSSQKDIVRTKVQTIHLRAFRKKLISEALSKTETLASGMFPTRQNFLLA